MKVYSPKLYIEINNSNFIFFVGNEDEYNNLKIIYKLDVPSRGIINNKISNFEEVHKLIKENIYMIEQKLKYTFRELIIILENFNTSFINLSGYKKLNGSQILKENITYILNSLRSYVQKNEKNKTVVHIFNSRFILDKQNIKNLPIGLFGDFYSHELSFSLINTNDYKNLKNIFDHCNLKIKKILIKSFIKGASISENNKNIDNFFQVKMNRENFKIFYFENNSLKSEQQFNFGLDIIISDISKITSLKKDFVEKLLKEIKLKEDTSEHELIDEKFFKGEIYKKIKKKLIFQIAYERVKEISEILVFKNINFKHFHDTSKTIFFELDRELQFKGLEEIFLKIFSNKNKYEFRLLDEMNVDSLLSTANKLVHFGWKTEAVPVIQPKKSIIARIFDTFFS